MTESTAARIVAILAENFDTEDRELSADTDFESLEFDSLVLVELAVILTREFGVEVTDEELVASTTIEGAAALVAAKVLAVAA
ncbi:acyl carrier protein [Streptomyces sp. SP17BM10]|uniref:acyl carrier protein n=1 Tax=Streptomyces sp. SP17BM10 TaxID=3002530 RepID=UPI002E77C4F0|nr:acyl carrier protein [Streptomyces sp. SP17BM10]MEE1784152.1 acyl carrier protein [Streptomyces sp. SP17BM10]